MNLHTATRRPITGRDGKPLLNPALIELERARRQNAENRVADRITQHSRIYRSGFAATRPA